jgi:hypothetical protein
MSEKTEDAKLILKLYDLRREEVMRKARNWFFMEFNPTSVEDIGKTAMGENSAYYRMVTSYWEMACSFVNNGALDAQMFNDANGEHRVVYLKHEPFLADIRATLKMPEYLKQVEQCIMNEPNAKEKMAAMRERMASMAAMREQMSKSQAG